MRSGLEWAGLAVAFAGWSWLTWRAAKELRASLPAKGLMRMFQMTGFALMWLVLPMQRVYSMHYGPLLSLGALEELLLWLFIGFPPATWVTTSVPRVLDRLMQSDENR
jgi:hypothetical protein